MMKIFSEHSKVFVASSYGHVHDVPKWLKVGGLP